MNRLTMVMITNNSADVIVGAISHALRLMAGINGIVAVYDDGSADKTVSIVSEFVRNFPEKIVLIPGETHYGSSRSALLVTRVIETEYQTVLSPEDVRLIGSSEELIRGIEYLDANAEQMMWQSPACPELVLFRTVSQGIRSARINLPSLVICVGQACNLKCKNCGNFAPYSPKESMRYDVGSIIADAASVLKYFRFETVGIQGGEPFLYSDLDRLLVYLGDHESLSSVTIATNGLIHPKESTLRLLKQYDVMVRISNYPAYGQTALEEKNRLEEMGIRVAFYQFAGGENAWKYMGRTEVERENDDAAVQKRFRNCDFNICTTLEDGKIVHCSRALNAARVQGFSLSPEDAVSVRGNETLRSDMIDYYRRFRFMESCRYCYGTSGSERIVPAEQIPASGPDDT
ncbi:MAG: radical SAM protein [Lachnospiraceae bacterium]|nr:radical SAM protein [Lachnospiraceae bacterium]